MLILGPARATLGTQFPGRGGGGLATGGTVQGGGAAPQAPDLGPGGKRRAGAAPPAGHEVEPAPGIEPGGGQPAKPGVERWFGGVEGEEGLHRHSLTPAQRRRRRNTNKAPARTRMTETAGRRPMDWLGVSPDRTTGGGGPRGIPSAP